MRPKRKHGNGQKRQSDSPARAGGLTHTDTFFFAPGRERPLERTSCSACRDTVVIHAFASPGNIFAIPSPLFRHVTGYPCPVLPSQHRPSPLPVFLSPQPSKSTVRFHRHSSPDCRPTKQQTRKSFIPLCHGPKSTRISDTLSTHTPIQATSYPIMHRLPRLCPSPSFISVAFTNSL